jgi:hypothetical protein
MRGSASRAAVAAFTVGAVALGGGVASASAACLPTPFVRDAMPLTAAMVNPTGTVTGPVDATGCNIGIYYSSGSSGTVNHADVFGANYFGIVNDGGDVNVTNSSIHDIGEDPFNGAQHGNGVLFVGSTATGQITRNSVFRYQKGGIALSANSVNIEVRANRVDGLGPVNFIAQNGIQVGNGGHAHIFNNRVRDNSYTGDNVASSGGILVFGGECYGTGTALTTGIVVEQNRLRGNDVGLYFSNLDSACNQVATPTNNVARRNVFRNDAINNTSGWGSAGEGYQAAISVNGRHDTLQGNKICGIGYKPNPTPPPYLFRIDATYAAINIIQKNNVNHC